MTTEYLRFCGFRVADAATGREAVEKTAALQPDLVLLDLVLPDTDGWAVISELRARDETARVNIAVQTANVTMDSRQKTRDVGVDMFLPKPCDLGTLVAQLASRLGTSAKTPI